MSSKGRGSARDRSGIHELVKSVNKHKNFRQLASYSVQCLQKAITPPTVGWEEARKEAYEAGALDAITAVLTKHKSDLVVLSSSTACLKSIASEPKYAGDLARSGALVGMLNAVEEQPDAKEGVQETLELLETVATFNPQALLDVGGCDAVVRLMRKSGKSHPSITKSCVAALENMNKCPDGGAALRDSGIVPDLLEAIKEPIADTSSTSGSEEVQSLMVEASFRLLDRMTRSKEHAEFIRESCDGMGSLSAALEVHSKNDRLCNLGGRLLTKLAAGNVPDLVRQMKTCEDPKQRASLSALLANLALEEETAERIVESGGVSVLLGTLGASSAGVIASSARAIGRIASDPAHIAELVEGGAVKAIVDAMKSHKDDPSLAGSVTPTLIKLASSPENARAVSKAGGVEVVLANLASHTESAETASSGLEFIENLGMMDFDVAGLTDVGETAARCIAAHPEDRSVQLSGLRVLAMVASSEAMVDDIVGADGLDAAVAAVARAATAISPRKSGEPKLSEDDDAYFSQLASTALYVIGSLCVVNGHRIALTNNTEHVDVLLRAVARFAAKPAVRDAARDLLDMVSDADLVAETWSTLDVAMAELAETKSKAAARAVESAILKCAALTLRPANAEAVVKESARKREDGEEDSSGLGILVRAIRTVATTSGVPKQDVLLSAASNALFGISDCVEKNPNLRSSLGESGAVEAVITAISKNPKLTQSVGSGIKFLKSFSTIEACAKTITDEHGIEACAAVLRANPSDPEIIGAAVDIMLRISSTDEGAVAVARHGGTRQLIATIHANTNTPGFAPTMSSCVSLLQRVSMTAVGAETLSKQGAVDAVLAAAESSGAAAHAAQTASAATSASAASAGGASAAGLASAPAGAATSDLTTRMLSRLLTEDDVHTTLDEFEELARTAASGGVPSFEDVRPVLAKLGHITTVSTFTETIAEREGIAHLATVLTAVTMSESASQESVHAILPTAFTALANVSRGAAIPEGLNVSAMVIKALDAGVAIPEALQCVMALSKDHTVATQLAGEGETGARIIELTSSLLRANMRNAEIAGATFAALAAAAQHADVAARIGSSDVLGIVREFLEDVDATTDAQSVSNALGLLRAIVRNSPEHARKVLSGGGVDLMKHVLTAQAIDSKAGNGAALAGAVEVLQSMVQHGGAEALETVRVSGAIKKVVRAVESHGDYVSSGGSMAATIAFFGECATADASVVEEIVAAGGNELVIAGMNKNGTDAELVSAGAKTLSVLGTGADAGRIAVEEVQALSASVGGSDVVTVDDVASLGLSVQKLGNMALLEGVVTSENAAAVMDTLSHAVALMAESEVASPEVMAAGVQSIGRLAAMGLASRIDESIVEQVLDVMSMADKSAVVRNSSIHTLAQLAQSGGLDVVTLMTDLGAVEAIAEMRRAHAADANLQSLTATAMVSITDTVIASSAALVGRAGGSETLFSIVAANSSDPTALASCVERMVASEEGRDALWCVLQAAAVHTANGTSTVSAGTMVDVVSEGVRALVHSFAEEAETSGEGVTFAGSARCMAGLSTALAKAVELQGALTETSDQRSRVLALRLAEDTLGLLSAASPDALGAAAFANGQGLKSLMGLLEANIADPETTSTLLSIVRSIAQAGSKEANEALAQSDTMGTIMAAIKAHAADEAVCADAIETAYFVAQVVGPEASGLDREALRLVADAQTDHAASDRVRAASAAVMDKMASVFSDEPAKIMNRALATASDTIGAALTIKQHVDDAGKVYFVNTATGETLHEAPKELVALTESVMAAAELSRGQSDDEVVTADTTAIKNMCAAMEAFAHSEEIASAAAETLSSLSLNARNTATIAENGGIRAIIAAVRAQPDKIALIKLLLVLLERISRNDAYKGMVAEEGGIEVVITIAVGRHYRDDDLATRGLATLANLAFNSDENTNAIVSAGGIDAVERCMQAHRTKPRTLEAAVCALSNIMFSDDEIKLKVGQSVGDELTLLVDDFATKDAALVKMAMRALGNCTYSEENVRYVAVENHATAAIVSSMRHFKGDAELLQIACEVLANFASLEEEGPPEDAPEEEQAEWMSVQRVVYDEEGAKEVLNAIQRMQANSAVVKAGFDALHNICSDLEVSSELVAELAVVPTLIDLGRQFDWDADLLEHLMPLLATLAESPDAAAAVVSLDGIPVIISAMEQHGMENTELLFAGQLALSSLAVHESARDAFANSNAVESLIAMIRDNAPNAADVGVRAYITEALQTLTRMCAKDELSVSIAQDGLHVILGVAEDQRDDAELLTACMRLITHLSFVEANLKAIIQSGGLNILINAVVDHPDERELVLRAVRGIDALAMSSKENAALTIEEGGQDLLEDVLASYPTDEEIQRASKSAILSMSALDQLKRSEKLGHKAARASRKTQAEVRTDPLASVRSKLAAGRVMSVWTKGTPKAAHVLVAPDFRSIVWQDARTKDKFGALDLRSVIEVNAGTGPDHKKRLLGRAAEPQKCLCVVGERTTLCLEATNKAQAAEWVTAFSKLLHVFKTDPTALG
ncbi:hypothetical protein FNF31_07374 [Cafeteria roenbergensis]|uniref:Uncharacterized protein n=1 Tax=Cafeteria roenbergensis TaxID=33653 RepID=A0A5A8C7A9_CAFRO|nr:hypothetical protein FNF31_07374 [Cafeteria roenbergensis]